MRSLIKIHSNIWPLSCSQCYFHISLWLPWPLTSAQKINGVHPLTKFDEHIQNRLVSIMFARSKCDWWTCCGVIKKYVHKSFYFLFEGLQNVLSIPKGTNTNEYSSIPIPEISPPRIIITFQWFWHDKVPINLWDTQCIIQVISQGIYSFHTIVIWILQNTFVRSFLKNLLQTVCEQIALAV